MPQETKQIEIAAPARKCYDTICDFASYPQWQKTISQVTILDYENSKPLIVEYHLSVMLKTMQYTLSYAYDEQNSQKLKLSWTYVGGDLKDLQGSYLFEEVAENKTIATYSLNLELNFVVPTFIMNNMRNSAMLESMQALKKRAEEKR